MNMLSGRVKIIIFVIVLLLITTVFILLLQYKIVYYIKQRTVIDNSKDWAKIT